MCSCLPCSSALTGGGNRTQVQYDISKEQLRIQNISKEIGTEPCSDKARAEVSRSQNDLGFGTLKIIQF